MKLCSCNVVTLVGVNDIDIKYSHFQSLSYRTNLACLSSASVRDPVICNKLCFVSFMKLKCTVHGHCLYLILLLFFNM